MDRAPSSLSLLPSSLSSCSHSPLPSPSSSLSPSSLLVSSSSILPCSSSTCPLCGLHIPLDTSNKPFKSKLYEFSLNLDIDQIAKSIFQKKLMKEITLKPNHPYSKNRSKLLDIIFKACKKLNLSQNTLQLSIVYLDYLVCVVFIPSSQHALYAITCILLAAKAIERDNRIPFISTMSKLSGFTAEQIKQTENILLELLEWNLQFCSLIDMVEYFLSQGILFFNDTVSIHLKKSEILDYISNESTGGSDFFDKKLKTRKKSIDFTSLALRPADNRDIVGEKGGKEERRKREEVEGGRKEEDIGKMGEKEREELVLRVEYECRKLSNIVVRDSQFLENSFKLLSAGIIAFIRKMHGIKDFWTDDLYQISLGVKRKEILEIIRKLEAKLNFNVIESKENLAAEERKENTRFFRRSVHFIGLRV